MMLLIGCSDMKSKFLNYLQELASISQIMLEISNRSCIYPQTSCGRVDKHLQPRLDFIAPIAKFPYVLDAPSDRKSRHLPKCYARRSPGFLKGIHLQKWSIWAKWSTAAPTRCSCVFWLQPDSMSPVGFLFVCRALCNCRKQHQTENHCTTFFYLFLLQMTARTIRSQHFFHYILPVKHFVWLIQQILKTFLIHLSSRSKLKCGS